MKKLTDGFPLKGNKRELLNTLLALVKQLSVNELKELIEIVKKRYAIE